MILGILTVLLLPWYRASSVFDFVNSVQCTLDLAFQDSVQGSIDNVPSVEDLGLHVLVEVPVVDVDGDNLTI